MRYHSGYLEYPLASLCGSSTEPFYLRLKVRNFKLTHYQKLMSGIGCPKEQAFRIIDASPLAEHMRNEFPVPAFLEDVTRDD